MENTYIKLTDSLTQIIKLSQAKTIIRQFLFDIKPQKVALEYKNVLQNIRKPKFGLTPNAGTHLQPITAMGFLAMFTFQLDNTKR